jgi:hypothetical protein
MSPLAENGNSRPLFLSIRFPDSFAVCWAGPHPFRPGLCFGSEDGMLLFTDEEGRALSWPPGKGSASGEAINGVACVGTWVAVSTRQEVNFWPLPGTEGGHQFGVVFPYGAHGVSATPSGYFIAPMGRLGILAQAPPFGAETEVTVQTAEKPGLYAYRVICLPSPDTGEVLACAARLAGIGAVAFFGSAQTHTLSTIAFSGLDVIDVCPLRPGERSLAVAALGRDGSLVLFQNVLTDKKPVPIKYDMVEGIAYRILSCGGDIFVLTSKGLYVLAQLAGRYLAGEPVGSIPTPVLPLPVEGVDANLCGNQWLLVVTPDEVRRYDVPLIHDSVARFVSEGEVKEFRPAPLPLVGQWTVAPQKTTGMLAGAGSH